MPVDMNQKTEGVYRCLQCYHEVGTITEIYTQEEKIDVLCEECGATSRHNIKEEKHRGGVDEKERSTTVVECRKGCGDTFRGKTANRQRGQHERKCAGKPTAPVPKPSPGDVKGSPKGDKSKTMLLEPAALATQLRIRAELLQKEAATLLTTAEILERKPNGEPKDK